jgi:hypothetical protein
MKSVNRRPILVEGVHKIQQIRAVQALDELGLELKILAVEDDNFRILNKYFGFKYSILNSRSEGQTFHHIRDLLNINHKEPTTTLCGVSKSLIFPKCIPEFLRSLWSDHRDVPISFSGLITDKRRSTLNHWLANVLEERNLISSEGYWDKIKRKLVDKYNLPFSMIKRFGIFHVHSSHRGRTFPIKSWDIDYYKFLLKSQFVLCPSGDFVWTYRFFESIMCGAIPIIEESCGAYDGFRFYTMKDKNLVYRKDWVEDNYGLCLERLTLNEAEKKQIVEMLNRG